MNREDARQYLLDCIRDNEDVLDLIVWAYDTGWKEGIEDYREEQDPTEEQEWRKTR